MYKLKDGVELNSLRKYGFKLGNEYINHEDCISNESEYNDYWLISTDPDNPEEIYEDDGVPLWYVHIQESKRIWIDCAPSCTYHIDNMDMEEMFYTLRNMILDGIIEDDYKVKE